MGKRNKEKRAAKRRNRQWRGPTPSRTGFAWGPHGPGCLCGGTDDHGSHDRGPVRPDVLAGELLVSARAHGAGDGTAATRFAAAHAHHGRTVATAAGMALAAVLGDLWHGGWLPADVWEIVRRRADGMATSLVVDGIAADNARHAPGSVHERWAAQIQRLEADVWWDRDRPHLDQWAERHGVSLDQALIATVTLLAELTELPALPLIVHPPGTGTHRPTARTVGVDQKVLARVRALLAKAESTSFPEEAEALSAKAQELMNRHAFERALLDAGTHREQTATSTRVWLDSPYVEAKAQLVAAIAKANRCESVFHPQLGFVALVGVELDLEITELLATSLLLQATRAMLAEGRQVTRGGTSRTRSFRQSFLVSYAVRIGERLTEAGARAHDAARDDRLLPVLAARSRAVDEAFRAMFSHTVRKTVSATNGAGWHAGRLAAERANLTVERHAIDA